MTHYPLRIGLFVMVIAATVALWIYRRSSVDQRPNVVLITLDTVRADRLGCYGYQQAATPNIDALAQRGVVFDRAYTTVPLTLPAHASIHTGLYPFEHTLYTNGSRGLPDEIPTLAETLSAQGYKTAAFIAAFVLNRIFGLDRGFDTYDDELDGPPTVEPPGDRRRSADQIVDRSLAWLNTSYQKPFFCWLHFFDPHAVYLDHRESFGDQFRNRPYDAEIAFVDSQLGRLFAFLDAKQLTQRTIIVVVADHGEGLNEHRERWHGYFAYNSTIHVPLIIAGPNVTTNVRAAETVSVIDLPRTLLDCLQVTCPTAIGGHSLAPALRGKDLIAAPCFAATHEAYLEEHRTPISCLITSDWKYIDSTKPELYDLQLDPHETQNVIDAHPENVNELQEQLAHLESSGRRYRSQTLSLSEQEHKNLSALGYVSTPEKNEHTEGLPDFKDMLDDFDSYQAALDWCMQGQTEAAISPLYQLTTRSPRYLAPRLLLANLLKDKQRFDEVQTQYLAILDIVPENVEANEGLGNLLASKGENEQAFGYLSRALETSPLSPNLHRSIGKVLQAMNRKRDAAVHFQLAESLFSRTRSRRQPVRNKISGEN